MIVSLPRFKTLNGFLKTGAAGLVLAGMMMSGVGLQNAVAQEQAQQQAAPTFAPDDIAFSVNGVTYTNRELATASLDVREQLEQVAPEERRPALINLLIDMVLLAEEAKKEKLHEVDSFKKRMEHLEALNLRNSYLNTIIRPLVTPEILQEEYVQTLARFEPQPEIRARHILVGNEAAAKEVIKELDGGKNFAELAREKSTGPSGPNGGDLGYFSKGQMVAPFQEAAEKIAKGDYSKEPVKTQFGWHVIMVEDKRASKAPTYEAVAAQLGARVFARLFQAKVLELRKAAKVEITGVDLQDGEATEEKKAE